MDGVRRPFIVGDDKVGFAVFRWEPGKAKPVRVGTRNGIKTKEQAKSILSQVERNDYTRA